MASGTGKAGSSRHHPARFGESFQALIGGSYK
jgi:hypothetical protein